MATVSASALDDFAAADGLLWAGAGSVDSGVEVRGADGMGSVASGGEVAWSSGAERFEPTGAEAGLSGRESSPRPCGC